MLCLFIFVKKDKQNNASMQNCSNTVIKLSFSFLLCEKKYKKCMVCGLIRYKAYIFLISYKNKIDV